MMGDFLILGMKTPFAKGIFLMGTEISFESFVVKEAKPIFSSIWSQRVIVIIFEMDWASKISRVCIFFGGVVEVEKKVPSTSISVLKVISKRPKKLVKRIKKNLLKKDFENIIGDRIFYELTIKLELIIILVFSFFSKKFIENRLKFQLFLEGKSKKKIFNKRNQKD